MPRRRPCWAYLDALRASAIKHLATQPSEASSHDLLERTAGFFLRAQPAPAHMPVAAPFTPPPAVQPTEVADEIDGPKVAAPPVVISPLCFYEAFVGYMLSWAGFLPSLPSLAVPVRGFLVASCFPVCRFSRCPPGPSRTPHQALVSFRVSAWHRSFPPCPFIFVFRFRVRLPARDLSFCCGWNVFCSLVSTALRQRQCCPVSRTSPFKPHGLYHWPSASGAVFNS